jgi:hypothetical protein
MGVDQEAGGKGLIGEVAMIGESNKEGDCVSTDMVHKLHAVKEHQEVKLVVEGRGLLVGGEVGWREKGEGGSEEK